jgi:hypothetical protein
MPSHDEAIEKLKRSAAHTSVDIPPATTTPAATAGRLREAHGANMGNLERAMRVNEASNASGQETVAQLGAQRETIGRSTKNSEAVLDDLTLARYTVRDIKRAMMRERVVKGLVLLGLVLVIIYLKWIRTK